MTYFFILGNNPTLSIAEITAKFPSEHFQLLNNEVFLLTTENTLNPKHIINELGGTIKIGIINNILKSLDSNTFPEIFKIANPEPGSKFKFGISYHGNNRFNPKPLAMRLKEHLKNNNTSSRWVTSKEKTLSSVVVEQNKLTNNGLELVIIQHNNEFQIGHTLAVQPFKSLSFRDYGRPARDDHSGMLPPKLAQILINLAAQNKNATILDPFCGSGTLLSEASLQKYTNLKGSDISEKAIKDTEKNINWTKTKFNINSPSPSLAQSQAQNLSKIFNLGSINAIITEPYLGPQRGKFDIKKTTDSLNTLYSKSLAEFYKILKPKGIIVIIFPIFNINDQKHFINPNLKNFKIINPIPTNLQKNPSIKLTNRNSIIYARPSQKVEREIIILQKVTTQ